MDAEVDLNVVMTGSGDFVEIQGTGEKNTFPQTQLIKMLDLVAPGINNLIKAQDEALMR